MAKKKNKAETILRRAEKLFNSGNFLLAEKEFLKIRNKIDHVDIDQKLEVCRKETRSVKVRQLIKDAHKAVQNEDLFRAIALFQDANALLPDPSLMGKVKELQERLAIEQRGEAAQLAAAAHDYAGAALIYARAWEETGQQEFLLKNALNLVKAERYEQAVGQFELLDHLEPEAVYAWGFALAKLNHYCGAMERWADLDLHDSGFVGQKEHLFELACSQENYMGVADFLDGMETSTDPELLALHAKCYFHLSREQMDFLAPMMTFWLTAVYSRQISDGFSNDPDVKDKIQQKLIRMAEQRINYHGDLQNTGRAANYLEIEKKLINDLVLLSRQQPGSACPISTPGYALISGSSAAILDLIRTNRNYFKDEVHYMETGGYYSRASQALYELKTGDVAKAMEYIDAMDPRAETDEFIDYVTRIVRLKYGFFALKNNDKSFLKYFRYSHELFLSVPAVEKGFTDLMLQCDGDQLFLYEELLLYLHKQHPSDLVGKALSFIMAKSAIKRYNTGTIKNKQVKVALEKALRLDENNELAHETLEQTCIELETEEIFSAMGRHKLNKAARLTADSAYSQVSDHFFDMINDLIDNFQQTSNGLDSGVKQIYLNDFLNAILIVDVSHPLINKIQAEIDRI
jgi:tetratricopeptide (TPR) repeat protein